MWLSSVPYGIPLLPQTLKCYVLSATLRAGSTYELRFDNARDVPVLAASVESEHPVEGRLVDKAFILERGCKWQ